MSQLGRRRFLIYSGATLGVSVLLKACGETPTNTGTPTESAAPTTESSPAASSGETIKVGLLHSLSGTMAISETTVVDAEELAI
jgi:urea transport system substrate-binding protein